MYVVPFVGAACVVVGFEHGDWGPAGGGLEPGEGLLAALERELAEEAGGRLLTYRPFAVLRCHSRAAGPYRSPQRHPDYDCLYGYGEVELLGPPQLRDGIERTVAVLVMPPQQAVWLLADKGRAWEAELYRLAAQCRAAAVSRSGQSRCLTSPIPAGNPAASGDTLPRGRGRPACEPSAREGMAPCCRGD